MENIKRIDEIDFIKGVLILLMVLFHLTYFTHKHENLTTWVYCFHMSSFLLLSGYLQKKANIVKTIRKILIPYIIVESIYIIGLSALGSILGSNNKVSLTFFSFWNHLLISPIGTYWYLHTLFLCIIVNYFISLLKIHDSIKLFISGIILFILTFYVDGLKWENIIYFLMGSFIQRLKFRINEFIVPSLWSIIPIILISLFSDNLQRGNLSGIGLTFFMISFLWNISTYIPKSSKKILCFCGRNSFCIVLFSPIFTILTKQYISLFKFDSTHILWAIISLIIVSVLCLFTAWICDTLKISQYIAGGKIYSQYE